MNKKIRALSAIVLTIALCVTNISLEARGGGGGGRGAGGRSGGMSRGGASRSGMSRGASSRGAGRSSGISKRSSGAGQRGNSNRGRGRGYNDHGNRGRGNTTNVNVNGGGRGNSGWGYGGAAVPILATTGIVAASVAAGSASSSASSARNAAESADRSANAAERANMAPTGRERYAQPTGQPGNMQSNASQRAQRMAIPETREGAIAASRNARSIQPRNPQAVNNALESNARSFKTPRNGNTSQANIQRGSIGHVNVGNRRVWGFYHNGNLYRTWFWGGMPYYWYNGFWTPWTDFWSIYPWWFSLSDSVRNSYYDNNDYDDVYDDGYNSGYDEGYEDGYSVVE